MTKAHLHTLFLYLGIFGLALVLYSNTFSHEYAYDDAIVFTTNDRVQNGLEGIPLLFKNIKGAETQYRYGYRPITLLSFALDYEWFGLDPGPSHIINTLLYALLCCLLYYFLRLLFPERSKWISLAIVVVFVLHPVHTEVVANIKSRDEILMMMFGIGSVVCYLKYLKGNSVRWVWGVLALLTVVVSFLSRENGLIFSGVLALVGVLKYSSKKQPLSHFWIPVSALLLLVGIRFFSFSALIFSDQTIDLSQKGSFFEEGFLGNPITDLTSVTEILPNTLYILLQYLKLLFYPYPLVHDYGYGYSFLVSWDNPWVWVSMLLHLAILYFLIKTRKTWGLLQFGILFYFLGIVLFTHLLQVAPDYMAERFLFVPSLGFAIAVVALAVKGFEMIQFKASPKYYLFSKYVGLFLFVSLCIVWFALTRNRNMAWKNNLSLFEADKKVLVNNARFNYNFGLALYQTAPKPLSDSRKDSILSYYKKSVAITDRSSRIILDYGRTLDAFDRANQAEAVFKKLVLKNPNSLAAHQYLTLAQFEKGNYQYVIDYVNKIKANNTIHSDLIYLEGASLVQLNKPQQALEVLRIGLKSKPQEAVYYNLLADLEYFLGDKKMAKSYLSQAILLSPANPELKTKFESWFAKQ
ncbi:MAG: hypothetical protein ABNH00_12345 [Dokdonia sp.]|jgi:tetratricopeptide (TPR) repeat protein